MTGIFKIFSRSLWSIRYLFLAIIGVELIRFAVTYVMAAQGVTNQIVVSNGNIMMAILIVMPLLVPFVMYRRAVKDHISPNAYFIGVVLAYAVMAAAFSVLNIAWYRMENMILADQVHFLNIIEVFGWNQFDNLGMFLYQGTAFLLVMACLHLLCSVHGKVGWILWLLVISGLSVGLSIFPLRMGIASGLTYLLFNDSWMEVSIMMGTAAAVLFLASWLFVITKKKAQVQPEAARTEPNIREERIVSTPMPAPTASPKASPIDTSPLLDLDLDLDLNKGNSFGYKSELK